MKNVYTAILLAMALVATAGAETTIFSSDFSGLTVGEEIPLGGPGVGQPVAKDRAIDATIVEDGGSPILRIQDATDFGTGTVRFEFLNDFEVTSGTVTIEVDLRVEDYASGDAVVLYVREHGFSAKTFLNLRFSTGGTVTVSDADGGSTSLPSYPEGETFTVVATFDMDAGTYGVAIGGNAVTDLTHGITDRGVGAVMVGQGNDADLDGTVYVERVEVRIDQDIVKSHPSSWGALKTSF